MPRRSPDAVVIGAVVTALKASTAVTGLVSSSDPRVYNNVPQHTVYPYVHVTLPTGRRSDTLGRFGAQSLVDVKVLSQAFGDLEGIQILDQCVQALDFTVPSISGHASLGLAYDDRTRYPEVVNGIVTRHHVASFRYWTEQSSS